MLFRSSLGRIGIGPLKTEKPRRIFDIAELRIGVGGVSGADEGGLQNDQKRKQGSSHHTATIATKILITYCFILFLKNSPARLKIRLLNAPAIFPLRRRPAICLGARPPISIARSLSEILWVCRKASTAGAYCTTAWARVQSVPHRQRSKPHASNTRASGSQISLNGNGSCDSVQAPLTLTTAFLRFASASNLGNSAHGCGGAGGVPETYFKCSLQNEMFRSDVMPCSTVRDGAPDNAA